mmetsp:Transcript_7352/g.11066  ORF Transcript_7352/g.11066 Transcript_7352/m.11066 type:complete len:141 (-) Transcript_7352:283-705(-)
METEQGYENASGKWFVTVGEVLDLKASEVSVKRDPYIRLTGGGGQIEYGRTSTKSYTLATTFDETFEVEANVSQEFVTIECWDSNTFTADELIGQAVVVLANQDPGWFHLQDQLQRSVGRVELKYHQVKDEPLCVNCVLI